MMDPITVDGHTYTKQDLVNIRTLVMGWRDAAMKQWPETIQFTVDASHVIGVLHHVIEQYPES